MVLVYLEFYIALKILGTCLTCVGLLKTLKEVLARRDADKCKKAIANEIINFLKQNTWKKVPMS